MVALFILPYKFYCYSVPECNELKMVVNLVARW